MASLKKLFTMKAILAVVIIIDCIVPLIIWPRGMDYFYLPKIIVIYALLIGALFISFISFRRRTVNFKFPKELLPLVIFIFFIILSAIFSEYRYQAFTGKTLRWEGAFAYTAYFLILYFSYLAANNMNNSRTIIRLLLFSSCIISSYGILQYFGIDMVPRDFIRKEWVNLSFSTLGNPNFLGSYLSVVFPASVCLYLTSGSKKHTAALFLITLLSYSALLCTLSRSAWVGTAFSLFVILTIIIKKFPKSIKRLASLSAVCILITFTLNNAHSSLISSKFKSFVTDIKAAAGDTDEKLHAGSQRLFIWNRAMGYIFERPILGSGPDTFDKVFEMSPDEAVQYFGSENIYVDKAHNDYLQIIVTMGFPALFAYLYFLVRIIWMALSFVYSNKVYAHSQNYILTASLLSGVLAYSVQAFFNISVVSAAPVFWSVMGMLAGVYELRIER